MLLVAAIHVGEPSRGLCAWYLLLNVEGVNFTQLLHSVEILQCSGISTGVGPSFARNMIRPIISLAQSDRERELVRYTAVKASGLSATAARKHFGFQNMAEKSQRVEACIKEARNYKRGGRQT